MKKNDNFNRILALAGTGLVWIPILATVLLSIAGTIRDRVLRFDYLMPAELFLFAFVGGGLLLWAALRAQSRRGLVAWGWVLLVVMLLGSQGLAVVTGLAHGEGEPGLWAWVVVIGALVAYTLALLELAAAGVLLLRDLFGQTGVSDRPFLS